MEIRASRRFVLLFLAAALVLAQSSPPPHEPRPPEYTFQIIRTFPHDPAAFTQGLEYRNGFLYEGTGLKGHSSLRKIRLETGEVLQQIDLPPEFFGEGIPLLKNEIIELTWQSHVGFVYNANDFHLLRRFSYPGEGWGLTSNNRSNEIFMSDGTRRNLRQHLADRSNRANIAKDRSSGWVDRPNRHSEPSLSTRVRSRAQRHRLRFRSQASFRNRQIVAKHLRNKVSPETSKSRDYS